MARRTDRGAVRAVAAVGIAVVGAASALVAGSTTVLPAGCPPGMVLAGAHDVALPPDQQALLPTTHQAPGLVGAGERADVGRAICVPVDGPETFADLAAQDLQRSSMRTSPDGHVPDDAVARAAGQSQALLANVDDVPGANGKWELYGRGPLRNDDDRFPEGTGQGLVHQTGRIDDFFHDPVNERLFAAIGTGGVWMSTDLGDSWELVSDGLPTQAVSSLTWTTEGGPDGTLVVATGEHTFGAFSYLGAGVWHSRDLGRTWSRSTGPLGNTFGFAVEVDPGAPNVVYAATGKGLWRSTDAGETFTDVRLPTGDCAADYSVDDCALANMVTDVVVKHPGGVGPDTDGSDVMAVVGWRGGNAVDPRTGAVQSPANGVYVSPSGAPGTFTRAEGIVEAVGGQEVLGRVELGIARGDEQNHDIVYAIVQDARALNGEVVDFQDNLLGVSTVLHGVYVTEDFGGSWTQLADENELSDACAANQSVYCVNGLIEPGAQAWYNQWIEPDPNGAQGGVPTRVIMGLEEIWQTRFPMFPQNTGATSFEVVGRYYGCVNILTSLVPEGCPAARAGVTSTHPDQHDGIFLTDATGRSVLLAGHDGGISVQEVIPNVPMQQNNWELEQFNGLHTLLPYEADIANDGIVYGAQQDNGQLVVLPEERFRHVGQYGADGVWTRVDPEDSDYVWESVQGALFNVSSDGGRTWTDAEPPSPNKQFVPAAEMDPLDADHVVAGGSQVNVTTVGPETTATSGWATVFDLGGPDVTLGSGPVPNIMTAVDVRGPGIYVGFCGTCDTLNNDIPFVNGIATNVGGTDQAVKGGPEGWHRIDPVGLPNRYITDVAIDPNDATQRTVYASLGGYFRRWHGPGVFEAGDDDPDVRVEAGNLWRSDDAGVTWSAVGGGLPNTTILNVTVRGEQLIVGTDIGVFISDDLDGTTWAPLGGGQMPTWPVEGVRIKADDPDVLLAAVYGGGFWLYHFPTEDQALDRVAGDDRYATAVAVSEAVFPTNGVDTVVLARGDAFPDALAGAPLAAREGGPILLTRPDELPRVTAEEIDRLGASTVLVLGGPSAISDGVAGQVEALGVGVQRIAGDDRFDTAALIAARVLDGTAMEDEEAGEHVYVARGIDEDPTRGWEDAMSIAAPAAKDQRPILLTRRDELPAATRELIVGREAPPAIQVLGGPAAVSRAVERTLQGLGDYRGRIAGDTRYGTSVEALDEGIAATLDSDQLWLARGDSFADALAATASVAADGGSFLLVAGDGLDRSAESGAYLRDVLCASERVRLIGGPAALSFDLQAELAGILAGCEAVPVAAYPAPVPATGNPPEPDETLTEVVSFGFEGGDEPAWTAVANGPNPAVLWTNGTEGADGSATSWTIAKQNYQDEGSTTVTSPSFALPGAGLYELRWQEASDTESDSTDFVQVSVSVDGGTTFEPIAISGGASPDYPAYGPRFVRFRTEASSDVQLRFTFSADEGCSGVAAPPAVCARGDEDGYDGFRFDDVSLSTVTAG